MPWFYANCDGIDDTGWGCVYRSFQNAMSLLKHDVQMRDLVTRFGRRWIEPPMLIEFVPAECKSRCFVWMRKPMWKQMITTPEDFEQIMDMVPLDMLARQLHELGSTHVFVIDDATFGYCLFFDNGWKLVDPHAGAQTLQNIELEPWLAKRDLWMVLAIAKCL